MHKLLAAAVLSLALATPPVARAADSFWVPVSDGLTWSFLVSGTIVDSDGRNEVFGPDRADLTFHAVDVQLLDHHADWLVDNFGSNYNGTYLSQTAAGLLRIADGDPRSDLQYRYFIDPQPWVLMTQPLDVGQVVSSAGLRRGRWLVPGGGTETWSGTWAETITYTGHESVTTPQGTFDALVLQSHQETTVDARSLFPNGRGRAFWDETRWFVPGLGFVKVQGSGRDETDFNGDGIVDRWQAETQLMVAVPEPSTLASLMAGLLIVLVLSARRRRTAPIRTA